MKATLAFSVLFIVSVSCANSTTKSDFIVETERQNVDEKSNSTLVTIITGKWNLIRIDAPWGMEPKNPINHVWDFTTRGFVSILQNDSIVKTIPIDLNKEKSGFSSDSIWVINGDFKDSRITSGFEIWVEGNKMTLMDQCDDCYSFYFESHTN